MSWSSLRVAALTCLAFVVSACVSVPRTYYDEADAAYLVVSIDAPLDTIYTSVSLYYRTADKSKFSWFRYHANNMFVGEKKARDFRDQERGGVVIIEKVAPGSYELYDLMTSWPTENVASAAQEFSVPFEVRANEIVYLGSYSLTPIRGRNFFGGLVPAGGLLSLSDQSARDIPIAESKGATGAVRIAVPAPSLLTSPYIQIGEPKIPEGFSAVR